MKETAFKMAVSNLRQIAEELGYKAREDINADLDAIIDATQFLERTNRKDDRMNCCALHSSLVIFSEIYTLARTHAVRRLCLVSDNIETFLERLYERKNERYGNAWEKNLDRFGLFPASIRIFEKASRAQTLARTGGKDDDESLTDTLIDMANYCVITTMWIMNNLCE